jgi:hypothetical protein
MLVLEVTYFDSKYKDMFGSSAGKTVNIGRVTEKGVESSLTVKPLKNPFARRELHVSGYREQGDRRGASAASEIPAGAI